MLRLGPRANLLLFTWRGVAVEVGVWLDRDLAVRPPSGGCQGHAHKHAAHHYRGMHMHTNTVHITTCCFGSCPPHCFGVSYNLNCVPAAGACTCTQARAQVCARFNPSLRAPSSFRDAGGCSHCNHSKHLAALHSRFSSSVTSRTSVTAGPASSDWPPFALPCWGSTSSFDTPGWRNRWQTAWPRRHVSAHHTLEHSPAPSATPQSLLAVAYLAHPHQEGKTAQPALSALLVVVAERKRDQRLTLANIGVRPAQPRRTFAFTR